MHPRRARARAPTPSSRTSRRPRHRPPHRAAQPPHVRRRSRARARARAASASSCSTSTASSRRTSASATRSATSASAPSRRPCARPIATALGYRLGGDEFAAILAGLGADAGHRFAHRVQDAMRVQHGGDEPSVAVGVAVGEMRTPDRRPHAPRRHRAARGQAHDLADPRALARARHRDAASRSPAGAGRTILAAALAAAVDAKDGDGYDHSRTVAELAGDIAELVGLLARRRSSSCARPGCCTTSATSTSTTRSSPRTSRRPTPSGTRSPRTPSAARASSRAAASARSRLGAPPPRAHRRRGLSRRLRRRRHPARVAHPARRRRLRGDDARPQLPAAHDRRGRAGRARAAGRHAVRPAVRRRAAARDRRARRPPEAGAQASIGMCPGSAATRAIHARTAG